MLPARRLGAPRRRPVLPLAAALAVALALPDAAPGVEPVTADRPGEATSVAVVPTGTLQVEAGIRYGKQTVRGAGRATALQVPDLLLRFAPRTWFELRLIVDGLVYQRKSPGKDGPQAGDLGIGSKVKLTEQHRALPEMSLLVELGFPLDDDAVTSQGIDPSGGLLANWGLTDRWSLDANLLLAGPSPSLGGGGRIFQVRPILSLGWAPTERLGAFAEWYAALKDGRANQQSADGGLTYRIGDDVQVDCSAGIGLNDAAPDYFVGGGLVWRWWLP